MLSFLALFSLKQCFLGIFATQLRVQRELINVKFSERCVSLESIMSLYLERKNVSITSDYGY